MSLKKINPINFLIIVVVLYFFFQCDEKSSRNKEVNNECIQAESVWENTLYNRIQTAPVGGGFRMKDYWVWGSSVINGDDGLYHMFASRWPKDVPFSPGWLLFSEVVHATSKSPEGPYEFSDVSLPARGPQYWDGRMTHNPRILKYKDTYILYYIGTTHPFAYLTNGDTLKGRSAYRDVAHVNQRIGIATSKSPFGPWERRDRPIIETKPNTFYSYFSSNPSPCINKDGSVAMLFKTRMYNKENKYPFKTPMVITLATAPGFEGPYTICDEGELFGPDKFGVIEDPFLWSDENGYHMIAKDMGSKLAGEHHAGILAHSHDAVHWELDKSPLAYSRTIKWSDGKEQVMGQMERPFGLIENGIITHLFFASMDGPGGFNRGTESWNMVVPLK